MNTADTSEFPALGRVWMESELDADVWLPVVRAFDTLAADARMTLSPEGIHVEAVDHGHTMYVMADVDAEFSESLTVGVGTGELANSDMSNDPETVTLRVDSGDRDLTVTAGNLMDWVTVKPADTVPDPIDLPDIEYGAAFDLPAVEFKAGLGASLGSRNGGVRIKPSDGDLRMTGAVAPEDVPGPGGYTAAVDGATGTATGVNIGDRQAAGLLRALPPRGDVAVRMGVDAPLRVESDLGITVVVAPMYVGGPDQ